MKIKTSEVTGAALDWAVAKAKKNIAAVRNLPKVFLQEREQGFHRYSSNWSQGGPIIERELIELTRESPTLWRATIDLDEGDFMVQINTGETHLIAAMRCYVASELGDEVDVPEELL